MGFWDFMDENSDQEKVLEIGRECPVCGHKFPPASLPDGGRLKHGLIVYDGCKVEPQPQRYTK
jgi:hypothetical protein